jgi:RHS repeat-associated protein
MIKRVHWKEPASSSVLTASRGDLIEETTYHSFGLPPQEHQLGLMNEDYRFIQKERDRESGLNSFGARFQQPAIGRWLSPDPLEERGGGLNPYAYVNQNPVKFLDSDGREIKITRTQIEQMYNEFAAGRLNQGSNQIGIYEASRRRPDPVH